MAPALPCKMSKKSKHGEIRSKTTDFKHKFACILEASESSTTAHGRISTKLSWGPFCRKGWQFTSTLQFGTKIYSLVSSHEDNRIKKQQWIKNVRNLKRFRRGIWQKSEENHRWSRKQGRRAQKFILPRWWTSVISRMPNWWQCTKNTKVELYSEAIWWKMILDLVQYLQNKDHQHLKWQLQKSWMSFPDCQGAQDKQPTQYLLIPKWKWKMLPLYWKFQNRNVQTFGFVYHDTKWTKTWSIMEVQLFLLSGTCTVILWQDYYGKGNLRKSYWNMAGRKFQIVNVSLYIVKKDYSYLCMWMT